MRNGCLGAATNASIVRICRLHLRKRVLSTLVLLLLSFVTPGRSLVEKKLPAGLAVLTLRTSCGTPQPCSVIPRTAKTLMIASWYGAKFQGKQTASGELFDQNKLTAASRTLPLGSTLRLTVPATGQSVVVRINDRGPWFEGRDLDISEAAATQLGIHRKGIATVEVSILSEGLRRP